MQFGLRVPCYRKWCRRRETTAIAQLAEDVGFDSVWVQDHVVAPLGPPDEIRVRGLDSWMSASKAPTSVTLFQYYAGDDWWMDPFAVWGFLAAITSRVRLASDIVVVPYRNPLIQAKMIGTLDVLSEGRMVVGTGTGHVPAEAEVLGVDFAARARIHDEYLAIMKGLLSAEEFSFDGEFYRFGPVRTLIRTVQEPHPPFYVGGHGKRAIRRAAEQGDGWLPSMVDPDGLTRGIDELHAACEAIGRAKPPVIALSLPSAFRFPAPGYQPRQSTTSPDDAISLLRRYERLGVEHVSLAFPMPTADIYLEQATFFASEVLPAFR